MTPLINDDRVARINADLRRALAQGDPDILAGRFSPHPLEPRVQGPATQRTITSTEHEREG